MASASLIEVIWHFAGYLQIFEDVARDHIEYDDIAAPRPVGDYTTPRPDYDHPFTPDDMETNGIRMPALAPDEATHLPPRSHFAHSPGDEPDVDAFPAARLPNILLPTSLGSGGGGGGVALTVTYQPGGEQSQVEIHQHNILYDDDTLLPAGSVLPASALTLQLAADTTALIQRLADDANGHIPTEWWIPQDGAKATDFLTSHDAAWAANGGAPDANAVQPGYYLNGVRQDPAPAAPDLQSPADPAPLSDTGHALGQWAVLGQNSSLNAALIVDLGESARTMIVQGDYFKTNAIFQTNTTVDHDHVSMSGATATPPQDGGDVATNIADFVQHPGIYASLPVTYAGPHWSVDVVDGNYYNVHTLVQTNYLFDNDVIAQTSSDTHYNLIGGYNQLDNLAQVFDGSIHYDLIVVEGAYHGMNVIFQNNILLNNDQIKMVADGADPTQSANSGQNELLNEATIENYGDGSIGAMNPGAHAVLGALEGGATSPDPNLGLDVAGSGGVFHVLYVRGDYYDVNAVWQTNVTSDVNVIYQLQNDPSAGALAYRPDGAQTQSVTTGGDHLTNDAAIIDVGPTNTVVGGQAYSDTILVQANLLPTHQDQAVNADTHALIPELVAFVHDSQDDTHTPPAAISASIQADPISSMLH